MIPPKLEGGGVKEVEVVEVEEDGEGEEANEEEEGEAVNALWSDLLGSFFVGDVVGVTTSTCIFLDINRDI